MKQKRLKKSTRRVAVLLALAVLLSMIPTQAFGAATPYELGMIGSDKNHRSKIGGKYFYCSGTVVTKPETMYVSATKTGKATKISTQGIKGVSFITVICNSNRIYYVYTDSSSRPTIKRKNTTGKSLVSYTGTRGKAKEHFELVGIYGGCLYYAAIPYNSTAAGYTLKCLNLTTKKVTIAKKNFEPYVRVGHYDRNGVKVNGRYAYGYGDADQNQTVIYDCKTKTAKLMKKGIHLDKVLGSKIYCRSTQSDQVDTTLSRYDANGTNPTPLFKGKCLYIEKITSTYFKYCVKKSPDSYEYNYYKFTFGKTPETGIKEKISSSEYYK